MTRVRHCRIGDGVIQLGSRSGSGGGERHRATGVRRSRSGRPSAGEAVEGVDGLRDVRSSGAEAEDADAAVEASGGGGAGEEDVSFRVDAVEEGAGGLVDFFG